MLRSEKQKEKNLSSTLEALKQIKKTPTLSERLKRAGIKEKKTTSDGKRNNATKRPKKKKDFCKKLYLEKVIIDGSKSETKAKRKLRNLKKNYLLPYMKEPCPGENTLENSLRLYKKPNENLPAAANETIFVSLDFIQDCQNYRKSVAKFIDLGRLRKKKQKKAQKKAQKKLILKCLDKKQESQSVKGLPNPPEQQQPSSFLSKKSEEKLAGTKTHDRENCDALLENAGEKDVSNSEELKYFFETDFFHKPLKNMSSDNVAKIDKKYLESLLSIAKGMEKGDKTKQENENKKAVKEKQSPKKSKITGNANAEGKVQNTEPRGNSPKNAKDVVPKSDEVQNEKDSMISYKDLISSKLTRDAAKSEIQIQPLKRKCTEGSKMKSEKNMSVSKHNQNEIRKKRKNRYNNAKDANEEFVEASLPSEVSKVTDVKELWRREGREKSENSLSSYSSCTVPEGDEIPEWKNLGLQSYKFLKKLVEEEVTKIRQKSVKKDNTVEIENKENISEAENSQIQKVGESKNNSGSLRKPLLENSGNVKKIHDTKVNEIPNAQTAPLNVKQRQHYSIYEGKKENSQLPNMFSENTLKEPKEKVKQLEGVEKSKKRISSEVVKNWTIINRLEQAFLALGTPNFVSGDRRNSKTLEEKNVNASRSNVAGSDKLRENSCKNIKKTRSKETPGRKKNSEQLSVVGKPIQKTFQDSSSQTLPLKTKKPKVDGNVSEKKIGGELKEKLQRNKSNKEFRNENSQTQTTLTDEENKLKVKEKKTPRCTPDRPLRKKSAVGSPDKIKIHVHDSRYAKRETKGSRSSPERLKLQEAKFNRFGKSAPKVTKLSQTRDKKAGHLERKKVLSTIHKKDSIAIQSRKSKSCHRVDNNIGMNGVKLCFSQTKTRENLKGKKEVGRITQSGGAKRSFKKMTKSVTIKENPVKSQEKTKIGGEKLYSIEKRASSAKISKPRSVQEKKSEKSTAANELPQQVLSRKEPDSNSIKRPIKERSILSLRASQHDERKVVPSVQEKSVTAFPNSVAASTETYEQDVHVDPCSLHRLLIDNESDSTCVSTRTFDLDDSNEQNNFPSANIRLIIKEFREDSEDAFEDPEENLSVSSLSSHVFGKRQSAVMKAEQNPRYALKSQQLWEQDINHYHAIVREIMSHYKRIDGFLKQSEHYGSFSSSFVNLLSEYTDTSGDVKPQPGDLQEYRKKVMCEYQALPFSEYKSKLQEKRDDITKSEEGRKRNLQVVKDVESGVDLDVKDFPLNIQKVLDSQLYVDSGIFTRLTEAPVKFKEKTSSLQDTQLFKSKISKAKINEIEH